MRPLISILLLISTLLLASCTPQVTNHYCDEFPDKDSVIQRIITQYDVESYLGLCCCYEDSNIDLYGFLVADSSGECEWYTPTYLPDGSNQYGLNDTITLFYTIKGLVMGRYVSFEDIRQQRIFFLDSIYTILQETYSDRYYGVSLKSKERYASEYSNLDSLYDVTINNADIESYYKLRLLASSDSLRLAAIEIANRTHSPIACCDVYMQTARRLRLPEDEFHTAYSYLCEASDSLYYPAIFLKAGLCLTGAYFSQDTILGKQLLDQCHATTFIPFWRQYSKPVVYQHLLHTKSD